MILLDTNIVSALMKAVPEFDSEAAGEFAAIGADRRQAGRPTSQADAQIAAIARSRGAELATRNVTDFEGCWIKIINPWGMAR